MPLSKKRNRERDAKRKTARLMALWERGPSYWRTRQTELSVEIDMMLRGYDAIKQREK